MTRRPRAVTALIVLLALQAAFATASGAVLVALMLAGDGPILGPLDPTAIGVLTIGLSMSAGVIALLCASAIGLWQQRPWAGTTTGLVQALLVVGSGVGLLSFGWQPVVVVLLAAGALGLLLLAGWRWKVPG